MKKVFRGRVPNPSLYPPSAAIAGSSHCRQPGKRTTPASVSAVSDRSLPAILRLPPILPREQDVGKTARKTFLFSLPACIMIQTDRSDLTPRSLAVYFERT